jgi:hypothetical protein
MRRLENHEAQQHARAATLLSSGEMPDLLYSADSNCINPAILCCMHACRKASYKKHVYLPAPHRDISHPVCSMPAPASITATCVEISMQEIGEVWWLFDAEQPYLAEVFKNGQVPESRLPHMDRSMMKGNHVARVLGSTRHHIKMLRPNASMFLYTPWCVPYVSTHLYLLRGNKYDASVAHERTCMQDLKPVPAERAARQQEAV